MNRAHDRVLWSSPYAELPDGTVLVAHDGTVRHLRDGQTMAFGFDGWGEPKPIPTDGPATALTPPTSVAALSHGFVLTLHPSAN